MPRFKVIRQPVPNKCRGSVSGQNAGPIVTCFKELITALAKVCEETKIALEKEMQSVKEELRREFQHFREH